MIRIVVLIKQVPDIRNAGRDVFNEDGTIKREQLPSICNPSDMKALEMALSLKDRFPDVFVSVLSMGPDSAESILKEALYRGADEAVLLTDRAFAKADTLATSRTLSAALRKMAPDFVICGSHSIDGGTSQVAASVAEFLGIPDVFSVLDIEALDEKSVVVRTEENVLKVPRPLLVSVSDNANECRYVNIRKYIEYRNKEICRLNLDSLGISPNLAGSKGSETVIHRISLNENKEQKEQITFSAQKEDIHNLVEIICNRLH